LDRAAGWSGTGAKAELVPTRVVGESCVHKQPRQYAAGPPPARRAADRRLDFCWSPVGINLTRGNTMIDPLSDEAQSALRRICDLDPGEAFIVVAEAIIAMQGIRDQREHMLQSLVWILENQRNQVAAK
jgi:hypothetical protein